ncbi:MAG: hypothetical protein P8N09_07545 [Planctomycetota bacterium]|nr:hypothetical protein [Planctomycetota bacterium]
MIVIPHSSGAGSVFRLLALLVTLCAWQSAGSHELPEPYTQQHVVHGIPILATDQVHEDYLAMAGLIYEHMTSRDDTVDLRALHQESGFRILLITEQESYLDLPEFEGEDPDINQAGGLGGCIGEFFIAVRVGSPHALVHEIGHGIYHSAIQFEETGGADDEDAWYAERVRAVHDCELEEAYERFGEEQIHEVLLAPEDTFSADLAAAWRNADAKGLWRGEYAATEPNEYWAEGVALWFRAWEAPEPWDDPRAWLEERDPMLHALCARLFPDTDWHPGLAHAATGSEVNFEDGPEADPEAFDALVEFLDRDGDERLEAYEAAEAFLLLVAEADLNGDRALDRFELTHHLDLQRHEEQDITDETAMFEQELLEFLAEVDHDGDGSFALNDLPPSERDEFEREFQQLDANEDGQLTESELLVLIDEEFRGATFEVQGERAIMTGVIGPTTPGRVLELVLEHPEVEQIVLQDMPGSMDDESNLRAASLMRRLGLSTHVPADGMVASGGTDLFLAGVRRSAEPGARFGVHSWADVGFEGADVPRDDPQHDLYLDYYREMGIPEAFYWYTLEAASADDIHWMTEDELEQYGFFTEGELESAEPDLYGGCILRTPLGSVPDALRHIGAVQPSEHPPFAKDLVAYGVVFAAEESVPDAFMENVGQTIAEMFRVGDDSDTQLQDAILTDLYRYEALLPVPRTERSLDRLVDEQDELWEEISSTHSVCDIIMSSVPQGQVMEVVEHILHAVTDVGLHHTFPEAWGLNRHSELWRAMQTAIGAGFYDVSSYDDFRGAPPEVFDRVLMQEFAYWFLTTAWDLQVPYGPDESEWTLRTPAELREALPHFYAVHERTSARALSAPTRETLAALGPTRAEER